MPCTNSPARLLLDLAIARLSFLRGAERVRLSQALHCGDDFASLSFFDLERIAGRPLLARGSSREWKPSALLERASRDRIAMERFGIGAVAFDDEAFPPLLREIADPPSLLFFRGRLPDPAMALLAVVGTRFPTAAGIADAYRFAFDAGVAGIPVVSGLARGIDAEAHRGNLDAGAPTVAVLGSGLDGIYPASNRLLAARILSSGGCLLSEYPVGESPRKWNFPARNRIIAGLGRATAVIEAPEHSGALITADFAAEEGRDLWVSSRSLQSAQGGGCRRLAADGAAVAAEFATIAGDWGMALQSPLSGEVQVPMDLDNVDASGVAAVLSRNLAHTLNLYQE